MADHLVRVVENRVIVQVAGAEVLLPLAQVAAELHIEKKLEGLSFSRAGTVLA